MGLKGYRLWAMGQLDSTCRAPPCATPEPENIEAGGDARSAGGAELAAAANSICAASRQGCLPRGVSDWLHGPSLPAVMN
jgi:hypothetical protein